MSCSMPCNPAAIVAANARYGLASAPGTRDSTRNDGPWPTRRNPHVRLSRPQASAVGAHDSGWYRLYELTVGAYIHASFRPVAMSPPSQPRNVGERWSGASSSHMRLSVPSGFQSCLLYTSPSPRDG